MGKRSANPENEQDELNRSGEAGWQALQQGDYAAAEPALERAVDAARRLAHRQSEAVFLSYLGLCRQSLGKVEEARRNLEDCLTLAAEGGLFKVEANARMLLGEQCREQGDSGQAIQHFLRALEASVDLGDEVGTEMSFGNLGLLYLERGWAEQAAECFYQALEVGSESPNRAAWLGSLGQCLAELGQFQEAIEYYQSAHDEALASGDLTAQSICLGSQGNVHFEQGDFAGAIRCYDQAVQLSRQAGDKAREGVWLGNIGNVYRKLGDMDRAIETCRQALKVAKSLKDRHSEAAHLDSLGDCHMSRGESEAALKSYGKALKISRSIVDRQGQRIYLSNMGRAYRNLGQLQPAFEFLSRAVDLFDEQRARIKSDDLKTTFAARGQDLYRDTVQVCLALGKRVEALEYVGRAKSRAILDLLSNSPIDVSELGDADDESLKRLAAREAELRNQIAKLEQLFWQGSSGAESGHRGGVIAPEESRKVYNEWRDTINKLKRRHPNYASLIAVQTLKYEEITGLWSPAASGGKRGRRLLDSKTAIIDYYWTDQYFLAAAVWEGLSEPQVYFTSDRSVLADFEADLADFLEMSATEGWEVPTSLCNRLYEHLMAPVLEGLPAHVTGLILVPHGSLYRLPFAALHDGERFLVERFALSYLPTASLIPVLARTSSGGKKRKLLSRYLVSAISDYSATRQEGLVFSSRLRSSAGLDDLTFTMEEAKTVYELGREMATEARLITNAEVKDSLPALFSQYPVVHFAGHAVFNPDEPLASGLVLADGSILTAASILQGNSLRTSCGKLLVLSACQTGVNMVTPGGEILGLARALMYAGMPNLVLSLWEVADRSTSTLMQDFHKTWQGGKPSIGEALQDAQKRALAEKQPIHAWAPFIHMGID